MAPSTGVVKAASIAGNVDRIAIRIPGGNATPAQLRCVAELAEAYGAPALHITTRGGLEMYHVRSEDVPAVQAALAGVGLTTKRGGGDPLRSEIAPAQRGHGAGDGSRSGYVTVPALVPMGRLSVDAALAIANLSEDFGDGVVHLTPEQNAEVRGVRDADVSTMLAAIEATGLRTVGSGDIDHAPAASHTATS